MEDITKEQKKEAFVKITIFVILISNFLRLIGISVAEISLPYFIISLSGTLVSFGLVVGIFYLTQSIFQVPMAVVSDKVGRKKIIMIGIIVYTLGTFLCFFAQNLVQLILFRAIQGAGAYSSIFQAVIGESYKEEEQGKGMSFYLMSYTFGYFGGISLGGYLSFYLGFRSVFLISGILAALSGILVFFFFKDNRTNRLDNQMDSEKKDQKNSLNLSNLKTLLKNPQFEAIVLVSSLRWFVFGGIVAYMIWVMQIQFHLDSIQTSYILIVIVAFYILFVGVTGKLVDRFNSKNILLLGQAIIILFSLLYFIVQATNDLTLYVLASLFSAIGLGLFETAISTITLKKIEEIDPELKGTGFGMSNTLGFALSSTGPIVLALLGEISLFLPYYFMSLVILISFLISLKFIKK